MPPCSCCDKDAEKLKKGLCGACYARQLRTGTTEYKSPAKELPCSFCGKEGKTVAKGLCNACYYRLKKNGTLEYKPKRVSPLHCKLEGCDKPVVARGYCEYHYRNDLTLGDPINNFGYGERSNHPMYETWKWQVRVNEGRVSEWDDFWSFVNAVGERPSENHTSRRYDPTQPWGPTNFYWMEKTASTDDRRVYIREWRKKNPLRSKGHSLQKHYGISFEKYMQMYEAQQGKCAICNSVKPSFCSETGRSQTLVVDHCHDKNHVRALLCHSCNKGLGHFFDDKKLLQAAIDYLNLHR